MTAIKAVFTVAGDIEEGPDGLIVYGDLENKVGKKYPKLPFKVASVSGVFDFETCGLTSFENFPSKADTINVQENPIVSLRGAEDIQCRAFMADRTDLVTLAHAPTARIYKFRDCKELVSTVGLPTAEIQEIDLSKCGKLTNISNLTEFLGADREFRLKSKIYYNPELPLLKIILLNGKPGYIPFDIDQSSIPAGIRSIIQEYTGKGWGNALNLIRALSDKGFRGNAKL